MGTPLVQDEIDCVQAFTIFIHYDHPVLADDVSERDYRSMSTPQFTVQPNPDVPFRILRETKDFLVVEKPAGVVTQPGKKHERDALLNGLFSQYGKALQNLGKNEISAFYIDWTDKPVG